MNGFGGGGFGGANATPQAEDSLAELLRTIQIPSNSTYQNDGTQTSGRPDLSWFFSAIQNSQPNGLPEGTQTSNPLDGLYTINRIGSRLLGYPQEGVFNAPNPNAPKGLLDSPQTQERKELMR
jgi:hypothetical protein